MRICAYPNGCFLPVFGTDKNTRIGYCKNHQFARTDLDRRTPIQKALEKAQVKVICDESLKNLAGGNNAELNRWFNERRKEMTGFCANCGGKSCRDDDKYFKFSIAHILPKAYFDSVKTHADNWIELCFWGNSSCHTQMDNKLLDLIDMNCFDQIVVKFQKIYPAIDNKEKRRIPKILLEYLNTDF